MAKLTKEEYKLHTQAEDLLKKETLTYEEKVFVYENWNEGAESINSKFGAFFTPFNFASDFRFEVLTGNDIRLVDLCAGIGMLSFMAYHFRDESERPKEIVCVELNPKYVEVGKKLLPEATWVCGSALDQKLIESLGHFDQCISNPPFGKVAHVEDVKNWLKYKGSEFEFKIMEIGSKISDYGSFILPQNSTPFKYSGAQIFIDYQRPNKNDYGSMPAKVEKFIKETGYEFHFNCGIDTTCYLEQWKGVKPICEVVNIDYAGKFY